MNKNNLIIFSIAAILGFIATVVGIVSISKHVMLGTISIFDSSWSEAGAYSSIADKFINHRNMILGLGLVGLSIGLVTLIASGVLLLKPISDSTDVRGSVGLLIMGILGIVLSSIAMSFNSDLNNITWIAKTAKDGVNFNPSAFSSAGANSYSGY